MNEVNATTCPAGPADRNDNQPNPDGEGMAERRSDISPVPPVFFDRQAFDPTLSGG
jgi:hypothetical protein